MSYQTRAALRRRRIDGLRALGWTVDVSTQTGSCRLEGLESWSFTITTAAGWVWVDGDPAKGRRPEPPHIIDGCGNVIDNTAAWTLMRKLLDKAAP